MTLEFYMGIIIGVLIFFVFLLYERIVRLSKKVGELEGINKGKYFAERSKFDVVNKVVKDVK